MKRTVYGCFQHQDFDAACGDCRLLAERYGLDVRQVVSAAVDALSRAGERCAPVDGGRVWGPERERIARGELQEALTPPDVLEMALRFDVQVARQMRALYESECPGCGRGGKEIPERDRCGESYRAETGGREVLLCKPCRRLYRMDGAAAEQIDARIEEALARSTTAP